MCAYVHTKTHIQIFLAALLVIIIKNWNNHSIHAQVKGEINPGLPTQWDTTQQSKGGIINSCHNLRISVLSENLSPPKKGVGPI
jgi:hypothetical protein